MSPNEGPTVVDGREEERAIVPVVVVPVEAGPEEEQRARRKQTAKTARDVAQDVLCAAAGRLGEVEMTRGGTNGAGQSEEESSDGS